MHICATGFIVNVLAQSLCDEVSRFCLSFFSHLHNSLLSTLDYQIIGRGVVMRASQGLWGTRELVGFIDRNMET